jgi:tRNA 2-selenouridine synthase
MRASRCVAIEATREARLEFLVRDYAYLGDDVPALQARIDNLKGLQSNETLDRWKGLAAARKLPELFAEFIDLHYDPLYQRSQNRNFQHYSEADIFRSTDLSPSGIRRLAQSILEFG